MTYRQSEMYNCAKYLKNLPLQSVSSRGNLQVVGESSGESSGGGIVTPRGYYTYFYSTIVAWETQRVCLQEELASRPVFHYNRIVAKCGVFHCFEFVDTEADRTNRMDALKNTLHLATIRLK